MNIPQINNQKKLLYLLGGLVILFVVLNMQAWSRVPAGLLIGVGIISFVWIGLKKESHPNKLFYLLIAAFVIRFCLGALWAWVLPEFGYDNPVNNAGYVMEDAFNRDMAAWELAQSDERLISAFQGYSHTDQYGGFLYLSASIYRYLGGEAHQPLMLISILSSISAVFNLFSR